MEHGIRPVSVLHTVVVDFCHAIVLLFLCGYSTTDVYPDRSDLHLRQPDGSRMFDRHVATAFVALVAQNASINVLAKVTRTGNKENLYAPGTLVILCETFKILLSLIFAANERKNQASASSSSAKGKRDHVGLLQSAREVVRDVLVVRRSELAGAALPSLLYAASNNLS